MKNSLIIFFILLVMSIVSNAKTKKEIINQIKTEALLNQVDPDLAVAIAMVESSLNPKAIGGLGEQGLFQLRPEFHNLDGTVANNIQVAIKYLKLIKDKHENTHTLAWFVHYNYGHNRILKNPEQTKYFKKVIKELGKIKFNRFVASH